VNKRPVMKSAKSVLVMTMNLHSHYLATQKGSKNYGHAFTVNMGEF
jgi:hypothetical protein